MPKGSAELTNARREEIIDACAKLYENMSFKEVTIKEIGNATSFTRTSIYNYYVAKEEIFLALLQREYIKWTEDLTAIITENDTLSKPEFADKLAHSLERRTILLALLSTNLHDIEENSRIERLIEFKREYKNSIEAIRRCLDKFCPEMSDDEKTEFIYSFLPFVYGIYPYAEVTSKQREAMDAVGLDFKYMSVYEIALLGIKCLLNA